MRDKGYLIGPAGKHRSERQGPKMAKRLKKTVPPRTKQREGVPRSTSLQGRETEIALIDQLLSRIDLGGSTLVISGAPGIEKSALLEEAKSRARERGIAVLSMTGVMAEIHIAFAGLELTLRPLMKQAKSLAPRQRSALLSAFGMSDDAADLASRSGDADASDGKCRS